MISYFIVAHCTFMKNFSRKLKAQFQVIFGQDSFPLKMSPFLTESISSLTDVEYLLLPLILFYKKIFPSLLASTWFVVRYFSFVEQTVLVIFPDYSFVSTKSPIFFFICLQMIDFEYFQYNLIFDISELSFSCI